MMIQQVKGVTYGPNKDVISCIFCDIVADKPKARRTEVVYEDEKVVAFVPLDVCASHHYLVSFKSQPDGISFRSLREWLSILLMGCLLHLLEISFPV